MKKFTAIALVVLMLVMSVPFAAFAAPKWTEVKTAADFAAMTDGNYWLTADIDLSTAAWTTKAEFKGTINGNGHTVTVPTDAVMFDKLSGTVKNLNLKGAMTLDNADASAFEAKNGNFKGPFIGVLANHAFGATIDNVHTNVNVTFTQAEDKIVSFGGLVGIAMAAYDITAENAISITKETVITNCTTDGVASVTLLVKDRAGCVGGIAGVCFGNVTIKNCAFYGEITAVNTKGQNGGIVGSAYSDGYMNNDGTKFTNLDTEEKKNEVIKGVVVENCLEAGKISLPTGNDQGGGLVGYARGLKLTNSISIGEISTGVKRNTLGIFGYCNITTNAWADINIEGCAAIGTYKNSSGDLTAVIFGNGTGFFPKNNLLATGQSVSFGAAAVADKQASGNDIVGDKAAVAAAFVRQNPNNFKLNNGVVEIILPEFTPEADPDFSAQGGNDNVETGDMTMALVLVSVVSLAAVTVIAKKKITE